jgi:hypothetical protein
MSFCCGRIKFGAGFIRRAGEGALAACPRRSAGTLDRFAVKLCPPYTSTS